jgi:hypothetical protein
MVPPVGYFGGESKFHPKAASLAYANFHPGNQAVRCIQFLLKVIAVYKIRYLRFASIENSAWELVRWTTGAKMDTQAAA